MTRVYVLVEGQTEESFIRDFLAPVLWPSAVSLIPIGLGGNAKYARVKREIARLLKQEKEAYCSTMLDLYGLGKGFPGTPLPSNLSGAEKACRTEQAVKADITDVRFLPYIQVREFEGLLFSDPEAFAAKLGVAGQAFRRIRDAFATPEDINDDPNSAPSKRVLRLYPSYQKVIDGTLAAQAVGIDRMRRECPHFDAWVEALAVISR